VPASANHDTTPTHQVRRVRLRAHRAARRAYLRHGCLRHACLRHACLRHACLRDACHTSIVSSHVASARVKRAAPLVPRHHRPACLPAQSAATPRPRDSSNMPPCATFATVCDSAPTPSVLRSRRPTHTACHLSPPTAHAGSALTQHAATAPALAPTPHLTLARCT